MGHRKLEAPRHGSLGVRPRKRASELTVRVRTWPSKTWIEVLEERYGSEVAKLGVPKQPIPLAYPVYKAGMTHAIIIEDRPRTPYSGKPVFVPVTILDAPPIVALAVRTYISENGALRSIGEAWRSPVEAVREVFEKFYKENPFFTGVSAKDIIRKYLSGLRKVNHGLVKPDPGGEYGFKFIETDFESRLKEIMREDVRAVSLIVSTIPVLSGIGKKKPELFEIRIGGGSISEQLKYAEKIVGSFITPRDVFLEGQLVDVIGVTKGKGFQGVIKRFGVKELPRWHKHRKGSRKIGARSPGFGTMSETPQAGQTGFHRRTELNKRILKIGLNGLEVVPKGGFLHYGLIYGPYIMVKGSVIGPAKRVLILRHPVRPPSGWLPINPPQITYLSLESKQGV
ncbi:50S ribosomal protein L3 [Thermogladius sp. 4427co]|uniref:50S ribosomal protein L3 n=1 Tax=Thermogladius sp. 4427co TaxID=3450718 RepID=UPI003F797CA5